MGSSGPDLTPQRRLAENIQGVGTQLQGMAQNPALQNLASGKMTPEEEKYFQQQRATIEAGRDPAVQGVRDLATSRGLFSSVGAITQEIGANQQIQGQLAQTYGQQADLSRQGLLQGTQLQQGILGSATGAYGQALGGQGNIANQQSEQEQALGKTIAGTGMAVGGILCFLGETKIKMADGSLKEVKDLDLDDEVLEGGKVLAKGISKVPEIIFNYKGVRVSGGHVVLEDEWKRVYRSQEAEKIGSSNEARYPIVTENHILITENGQVWTDYAETPQGYEANDVERITWLNSDENADKTNYLKGLLCQ